MYPALSHWRHFKLTNRHIYRFAIIAFLYAIANGMVAFILPVVLEERIKNLTIVGLILAFSSVWNITTDFIIGFLKKPPTYRLLIQFIGLSILAFFGGILMFDEIWMLILGACLWGMYTEFYNFANFDFVVNNCEEKDRGLDFGLLSNFRFLGYTIAPIIAGATIIVSQELTLVTGLFFAICILVLFNLQLWLKKLPQPQPIIKKRFHGLREFLLWLKIVKKVFPMLFVYFVEGSADGVLTSFMPIFVMSSENLKPYGGLILAVSTIPMMLLSGWFGHLADKKGRKKFILLGLLLSMFALLFLGFSQTALVAGSLALLSGIGYSLFVSSVDASQGEYIEKHHSQENEVVGESGIFYNFGFILGAGVTGFLTTILGGFGPAFAIFGLLYGVAFVVFWAFGPKKYSLKDGTIG